MAVDLARYVVSLEAQTAQYIAELQKANTKLDEFHSFQMRVVGDIKRMFTGLISLAGARMFVRWIESSIEAADQMVKMAQRTGVAIETLQGMRLAAELAGIDVGLLQASLMGLARAMSEAAANADSKAGEAFKRLGIAVKNTDGSMRSEEQVLRAVADRYQQMADGADKATISRTLFGRAGGMLIPMLNAGSKNFDDMIEKLRSLGALWTMDSALAAEHFNDNLKVMQVASQGVASTIAQGLLPAMNDITDAMIAFAQEGSTAKQIGEALGIILKSLATAAVVAGYGMVTLAERMAASLAAMNELKGHGLFDTRSLRERLAAARAIIAEYVADQNRQEKAMNDILDKLWGGGTGSAAGNTLRAGAAAQRELAGATDASNKQAKSFIDSMLLEANSFGKTKRQIEALKIEMMDFDEVTKQLALGALNLAAAEEDAFNARTLNQESAMRGAYAEMWQHYLDERQDIADAESRIQAEKNEEIRLTIEWVKKLRDEYEAYWRGVLAFHGDEKGAWGPEGSATNPIKKMEKQWDTFARSLGRGLHDSLVDAFMGVEVEWADLLKRMAAEMLVSSVFQMLSTLGQEGGFWQTMVKGMGIVPGNIPYPGRAAGGPVSAGTIYRVHPGEAFFQPDMSGVVGRTGSGGVFIEQHLHFDVGLESVDQRIREASGPISQATMSAIIKAQTRPSMA